MTAALPALYMILTGATVGLIFGFVIKPRTVNRPADTRVRRIAIAAGSGGIAGLGVAVLAYLAVGVN